LLPALTEGAYLPPEPRVGLLPLPGSFEALFHESLGLPCELCGVPPTSRAICLSCGACVCGLETLHGPRAAFSHAHACGEGSAVFLLTNTSAVLLVRERKLKLLGSPYRDAHGETDLGLVRGRPLTLDTPEYESLSRSWLGLSFVETQREQTEQHW